MCDVGVAVDLRHGAVDWVDALVALYDLEVGGGETAAASGILEVRLAWSLHPPASVQFWFAKARVASMTVGKYLREYALSVCHQGEWVM